MLDFCLWTTYLASLMSVSTDDWSSQQKFYRNRHDLDDCYEISIISNDNGHFPFYVGFFFPVSPQDFYWTLWGSVSQMTTDMFHLS